MVQGEKIDVGPLDFMPQKMYAPKKSTHKHATSLVLARDMQK